MSKIRDLMEFSQWLNNKPKRIYFAVMQNKRYLPRHQSSIHQELAQATLRKKIAKPQLEE